MIIPDSGSANFRPRVMAARAQTLRMLDIRRTMHNFVVPGRDGKTPAMRLRLLGKTESVKDILLYPGGARRTQGGA